MFHGTYSGIGQSDLDGEHYGKSLIYLWSYPVILWQSTPKGRDSRCANRLTDIPSP